MTGKKLEHVKVNEEYLVTYDFNSGQMRLIIDTNHGTHHHSVSLFTTIRVVLRVVKLSIVLF